MKKEQQEQEQFIVETFGKGSYTPAFSESINTGGWINFGEDNDLPDYYIDLLSKSSVHSAIVKGKSQIIGGYGWEKQGLSNEALTFIKNPNNKESLDDILAKVSYDLETFGAFALNIIWSNDRTSISNISYISPQKLRIAAPDLSSKVDDYFICDDWKNIYVRKPVRYAGFSTVDRSDGSQILYVKEYRPGRYYYGEPEYICALKWIELTYEISNFHLSNMRNSYTPSLIITHISDIPDKEKMDMYYKRLARQYEGAGNAGKIITLFAPSKEKAPEVTPLNTNDNDTKYIEVSKEAISGIFTGHRVTNPAIFSVKEEGGLINNSNELLDSLEMFQSMYVKPKQLFIENIFNKLARINGIEDTLNITEYKLNFTKADLTINDVLTILQAPITNEQKINMLIKSGYDEDEAVKLVGNPAPEPTGPKIDE